jgi:hypothetical protein
MSKAMVASLKGYHACSQHVWYDMANYPAGISITLRSRDIMNEFASLNILWCVINRISPNHWRSNC